MEIITQQATLGEVERALGWRSKNNVEYSRKAFERALELIDLMLEHSQKRSHLKEIARMREALVDYFYGTNEFKSTEISERVYDRRWRSSSIRSAREFGFTRTCTRS